MKWLLALILAVVMVTPAFAGEDPYIAIVGTDCVALDTNYYGQSCTSGFLSFADPFYFSPKYRQFMYNEYASPFYIPTAFSSFPPVNQYTRAVGTGTEQFRPQTLNSIDEVCFKGQDSVIPTDTQPVRLPGLKSAKTPAGNAGFYEWFILLPKKPDGEINIVIQCGVVKPNAVAAWGRQAIELCAAETGERIGVGNCVREEVDPGTSPVIQTALPKITAIAYPGAYNVAFAPFHLTAFKNPSSYTLTFDAASGAISNTSNSRLLIAIAPGTTNSQVLDGSTNARVLLKACMDKTVITKLPVTGQVNALGETENDLEPGDMIYVRMDVPRQNSVDIYCHQQSTKIMGIGESPE